jgi:hypothetical protein
VAAHMRCEGLTEGELTLNNIVCGNRGYDNDWPVTCEKYLRSASTGRRPANRVGHPGRWADLVEPDLRRYR